MAMIRQERAKQFAPFEALNGLRQALLKKEAEHEQVEKSELTEDATEAINETIITLHVNDRVHIKYYFNGCYLTVEGIVKKIDFIYKYIEIENKKYGFNIIFGLEKL